VASKFNSGNEFDAQFLRQWQCFPYSIGIVVVGDGHGFQANASTVTE
jgi:hypothetical protein